MSKVNPLLGEQLIDACEELATNLQRCSLPETGKAVIGMCRVVLEESAWVMDRDGYDNGFDFDYDQMSQSERIIYYNAIIVLHSLLSCLDKYAEIRAWSVRDTMVSILAKLEAVWGNRNPGGTPPDDIDYDTWEKEIVTVAGIPMITIEGKVAV